MLDADDRPAVSPKPAGRRLRLADRHRAIRTAPPTVDVRTSIGVHIRHTRTPADGAAGKSVAPVTGAAYGRLVGIFLNMVRRVRLRGVAAGLGLASAC